QALPNVPGKVIDGCNRELDKASATLGPRHRSVLHDPLSAGQACAKVAREMGRPGEEGAYAAMAHLVEDIVSDGMVKMQIGPRLTAKNIFDFWTDYFL
ncbi:MAG: hypothetical protein OK454_08430, partial [Thaumarchaeota archaeon]|nr:hypothetical protein [Nitrososphaerota archaeon]